MTIVLVVDINNSDREIAISVGNLTVFVTEITIFVKCYAQSTGVVPASPWSCLAEITSQSAENAQTCHPAGVFGYCCAQALTF